MGWLDDFWRDTVAAAGIIVSLVGFTIAIYQAWRSRSAAEAVRVAMTQNLTAVDLERAANGIQEIRNLHRRGEWESALYRYRDIQRMLSDVRVRHPNLTSSQRASIQGTIVRLGAIDRRVRETSQTGVNPIESSDDGALLKAQMTLDDLASELKQQV